MTDTNKHAEERREYHDLLKTAVTRAHELNAMLDVQLAICCPVEPEQSDLRKAARLRIDIAKACAGMRRIEAAVEQSFGVQALLGVDAPDEIRIALSLLAAKALTNAVQIHSVTVLAEMAAADSVERLLTIHEAMQQGGVLRPHVGVDARNARNVGEFLDPCITEQALVRLLGLNEQGAAEFIELSRARKMFAESGHGTGYGRG